MWLSLHRYRHRTGTGPHPSPPSPPSPPPRNPSFVFYPNLFHPINPSLHTPPSPPLPCLSFPPRREHALGRSYRIFRYNVFHHIGHISTLAQPVNRYNPGTVGRHPTP